MRSGSPRTTSFNVSCRIPLPVFTGPLPWGRGWPGRDQGHLRILLAWRGEGQPVALLEAQTGSSPGENLGAFMECWLCTGAFLGPSRGLLSLILLAIVTDPLAGLSRVSPAGRCAVGKRKSGSGSGRARTDGWSSRRGPGEGRLLRVCSAALVVVASSRGGLAAPMAARWARAARPGFLPALPLGSALRHRHSPAGPVTALGPQLPGRWCRDRAPGHAFPPAL